MTSSAEVLIYIQQFFISSLYQGIYCAFNPSRKFSNDIGFVIFMKLVIYKYITFNACLEVASNISVMYVHRYSFLFFIHRWNLLLLLVLKLNENDGSNRSQFHLVFRKINFLLTYFILANFLLIKFIEKKDKNKINKIWKSLIETDIVFPHRTRQSFLNKNKRS